MQSLGRLLYDITLIPFTINHYKFIINDYNVSQIVDETDMPRIKVRIVGKVDGESFVTYIDFPASHTFKMASDLPSDHQVVFDEYTMGLTAVSRQFIFQLIADGLQRDAVARNQHVGTTLGDLIDVAKDIIK